MWAWLKACVPAYLDATVRKGLLALLASVNTLTNASTAFAQLATGNQIAVHQALLSPHWERIYTGGAVTAPEEHRHKALEKLRDEGKLPETDTLLEFLHNEYALDAESRDIVDKLRPEVEDDLDKVDLDVGDTDMLLLPEPT